MTYPYYYSWRNNSKRATMYRRACRVLVRGKMNSALIEFENGERCSTSGNAIRRLANPPRVIDDICVTCSRCGQYHTIYAPCPALDNPDTEARNRV